MTFTEEYASNKVQSWAQEIACLPEVATTQLHVAKAVLIPGLPRHWSCISNTNPTYPTGKVMHQILISAFTGYAVSSEGELLNLPVRLAGISKPKVLSLSPNKYILPCGSHCHTRN